MIIIPTLQMGKWSLREVKNMSEVPGYCLVGLGFEPRSLRLRVSNHSAIPLLDSRTLFTKLTPGIKSGPGINTWLQETQLFGGGNSCAFIYHFTKPHELKHHKVRLTQSQTRGQVIIVLIKENKFRSPLPFLVKTLEY